MSEGFSNITREGVSNFGNAIKKDISDINDARRIAKANKGNEAIVRESDGSYSLYELSKTQNDTVYDELSLYGMSEGKRLSGEWKEGKLPFKIIELNIEDNTILRHEVSSEEINNGPSIEGIGTKISDIYLDNEKENKFTEMEDAIAAAIGHEGIEGVVKNKDGTYSLYRISQEQLDKIMNDSSYSGPVEKLVVPVSFRGTYLKDSNSEIFYAKDPEKLNKYNEFKDRLKNAPDILNDMSGVFEKRADQLVIGGNEAINLKSAADEIKKLLSTVQGVDFALEKLSDIGKMSPENIKVSDISLLNSIYHGIMGQIEDGTLKVSDGAKTKLKVLGEKINNLEKAQEVFNKEIKEYNETIDTTKKDTQALINQIAELKKKDPDNKLLKPLDKILNNYMMVLQSGNREDITLYGSYVKKVLQYISEGGNDITKLRLMEAKYNSLALKLSEFRRVGSFSGETGDSQENFMYHLKSFVPENSQESELFENLFKNYSSSPRKVQGTEKAPLDATYNFKASQNELTNDNNLKNNNLTPVAQTDLNTYSDKKSALPIENNFSEDIKPSDFKALTDSKIKTPDGKVTTLKESMNRVINDTDKVAKCILNVVKAETNVKEAASDLINFIKNDNDEPTIMDLLKKYLNNQRDTLISEMRNMELNQIIGEIIKKAKDLQENLVLDLDGSSADITPLLEKFREIISELDLKTKEHVSKKLVSKLIDQNFSMYIKENTEQIKKLDEAKDILEKLFKESTEVKDASMSFNLKQIKIEDISLKIALVALSHF